MDQGMSIFTLYVIIKSLMFYYICHCVQATPLRFNVPVSLHDILHSVHDT